MKYFLTDLEEWNTLLPLTYTRSVAELRIGILTFREKWEKHLHEKVAVIARDYLQIKYPAIEEQEDYIVINAAVLPAPALCHRIAELKQGEELFFDGKFIAGRSSGNPESPVFREQSQWQGELLRIERPWQLFQHNASELERDFDLLTRGRNSAPISASNTFIRGEQSRVFLEEGAKMEASVINATTGPVYLAKNAEIMEGCIIRGGLALGEGAQLKMGAKIYGATTIGPHCRVGGEVNNAVLLANSNKAHDGFLGNSVLGEWCNLGADTNNSNLKNNYGMVSVFEIASEKMINTGLQFCGLIMGDHSKAGINTMFNTGTVVGVNANVFGGGFPPKFIPSFAWGGADGFDTFDLEKSFEVSERVMSRRNQSFTPNDAEIMRHIFNLTAKSRS